MSPLQNHEPTPATSSIFARSVLDIAAEIEQAEGKIKQAILNAASAGDVQTVIDIISKWIKEPVVDVAAALHANALDPCGASEVSEGGDRARGATRRNGDPPCES